MSFHVGQKVVCVSTRGFIAVVPTDPVVGGVYTIREIQTYGSELILALHEIHNDPTYWSDFYRAYRFRPVIERKTDIGIFTAMLTPKTKQLEDVRT